MAQRTDVDVGHQSWLVGICFFIFLAVLFWPFRASPKPKTISKQRQQHVDARHSTPGAAATSSSGNVTRILLPAGDASVESLSAQLKAIKQTYRHVGRRFAAWWTLGEGGAQEVPAGEVFRHAARGGTAGAGANSTWRLCCCMFCAQNHKTHSPSVTVW